jgi:hypothetical protein
MGTHAGAYLGVGDEHVIESEAEASLWLHQRVAGRHGGDELLELGGCAAHLGLVSGKTEEAVALQHLGDDGGQVVLHRVAVGSVEHGL